MNSQQELLDAINTISQKQDRSCDTPATVLRVEDDTVWVHIDGGADETPVRKTINCEQGETVQVRISNGSAFLVGNASAPPTDDKTANVAHFVAEQADIKATDANVKATEAKETVEVLEVEVEGKVDSGDSNIQSLSSTMYQNANGVNIFNDSLAVGDSYAHIDGDEFCIREVTSAGVIDDVNDKVVASFGETVTIGNIDDGYSVIIGGQNVEFHSLETAIASISTDYGLMFGVPVGNYSSFTKTRLGIYYTLAQNFKDSLTLESDEIYLYKKRPESGGALIWNTKLTADGLYTDGSIYNFDGTECRLPHILNSSTISAGTTSYTFTSDTIKDTYTFDIYDTIFGFTPTGITVTDGSCTITFPAQSSSHNIRLFMWE